MSATQESPEIVHLRDVVLPRAASLLPSAWDTQEASAMLIAIALQESDGLHRYQHQGGPARGLWQFERGGGVAGVLRHSATFQLARDVCHARGLGPWVTVSAAYDALADDDVLACCLARLLLRTEAAPLPRREQQDEAWRQYADSLWRPGKPHPAKWPRCWARAWEALGWQPHPQAPDGA